MKDIYMTHVIELIFFIILKKVFNNEIEMFFFKSIYI
jgi:hypothetical protein